ncbi:PH domain-containing protein [Plasmodiophora brassicae]
MEEPSRRRSRSVGDLAAPFEPDTPGPRSDPLRTSRSSTSDLGVPSPIMSEESPVTPQVSFRCMERQGVLLKRRPHATTRFGPWASQQWHPRLFILRSDRLLYFKVDEPRARGRIDLHSVTEVAATPHASRARFSIKLEGKCFDLEAGNNTERDAWVSDIVGNVNRCRPGTTAETKEERPWRIRSMPEVGPMRQVIPASEVVSQCRTGDVVLFRSRGIRGGIVRQATSSSYDHIGMVLKFKTKEVGVLEALGNTGVHVSNWVGFIKEKWHEQYSEMAIRHLTSAIPRPTAAHLEAFCRRSIGKKYSWTPIRHVLRRRNTVANTDDDRRTYFCSELVASAYKSIGYLRSDLPSSAYTPGMFSSSYNLQLLANDLGTELAIDFSC